MQSWVVSFVHSNLMVNEVDSCLSIYSVVLGNWIELETWQLSWLVTFILYIIHTLHCWENLGIRCGSCLDWLFYLVLFDVGRIFVSISWLSTFHIALNIYLVCTNSLKCIEISWSSLLATWVILMNISSRAWYPKLNKSLARSYTIGYVELFCAHNRHRQQW